MTKIHQIKRWDRTLLQQDAYSQRVKSDREYVLYVQLKTFGCDMAHHALSRWTGLAWSHPGPFGPDLAKNSHFWSPGCLDRCLELAKMAPSYTFPSIGM